ncbi:hypothetical protein [Wenyingzhuangia sp. IMCC45574]
MSLKLLNTFLFLIFFVVFSAKLSSQDLTTNKTKTVLDLNSDRQILRLEALKQKLLQEGDTLKAVDVIVAASRLYGGNGNYAKSYDGFWEALIYTSRYKDSLRLGKIYRSLGMMYGVFGRNADAEKYFTSSLKVLNAFGKKHVKAQEGLSDAYYVFANYNRENGNYGLAQTYLDSCKNIRIRLNRDINTATVNATQGYIHLGAGDLKKAEENLLAAESMIGEDNKPYQVLLFSFLGDLYLTKGDFKKSEQYYLNSLKAFDTYKSHQNYIPNDYYQLSKIYLKTKKYSLAYEYLEKAKDLNEELFGAKGTNNKSVIEIKDDYRKEVQNQKFRLEKVRNHELEQQKKILFLRNSILSISVVFIAVIALAIVWYVNKKRKSEHLSFTNEQQLTKEKNDEVVNFKNKELTSSALQLIHKDELINEIKELIVGVDAQDRTPINTILTKIKVNKSYDWNEFNARFSMVNKSFYKTLSEQYPKLTRKDHRLCALIKLNFSSKEIALLLGISNESVNTSRYRLRKKMNLSKEEDLSELIMRLS